MKSIYLFIIVFFLSMVSAKATTVYDLERDYSSLNARIDILMDPNLTEFVFSTHILKLDHGGMLFLALLKLASDRGVKITGVVDRNIGGADNGVLTYLEQNNIKIGYYNPLLISRFDIFHPVQSFNELNKRLHDKGWVAKIKVQDSNNPGIKEKIIALTGDKNISASYFALVKVLLPNQNTMNGRETLIDGGAVPTKIYNYFMELISNKDLVIFPKFSLDILKAQKFEIKLEKYVKWLRERKQKKYLVNSDNVQEMDLFWKKIRFEVEDDSIDFISDKVVEGQRVSTYSQILDMLKDANQGEEILIENPYFVLEPKLIDVLETLKAKGCKVILLTNLPEYSDVWFIRQSTKVDLERIAKLGVEVHFIAHPSRITHAKMAVLGNRKVYRGSANFDPRSLNLNSESGEIYDNAEMAQYFRKRFYTRIYSYSVFGAYNGKVYVDKEFQKYFLKNKVIKTIVQVLSLNTIKYDVKPYFNFYFRSKNVNMQCLSFYMNSITYKQNYFRKFFVELFRNYL